MKKLFAAIILFLPLLSMASPPPTLLQMVGAHPAPATLYNSVLLIIDAQQEYVTGALPLTAIDRALSEGSRLLARARAAGTPVVHIVHHGNVALFNPQGPGFAIARALAPEAGEAVIEKRLPNAFAGTPLQKVLAESGRKHLIVIGFMTHMCVSATVRAALDHGYATTVVAAATATRDLPDGQGETIPAEVVQKSSLAALADRFATVVRRGNEIGD